MTTVHLVAGDALPNCPFSLVDDDTGLPIDLTEASHINLRLRMVGDTSVQTVSCVVDDAPNGYISVLWGSTTLADEGMYEADVCINHANGYTQTIRKKVYFDVRERIA